MGPDPTVLAEETAKELLNIHQNRPAPTGGIKSAAALAVLLENGWVTRDFLVENETPYVPTTKGDLRVYASTQLVPMLKRWRSSTESDLSDERTDHYKPGYGSMSILVAPAYLEKMALGGQAAPFSKEECFLIARMAHPYFVRALREDREGFSSTYDFIYGAWY